MARRRLKLVLIAAVALLLLAFGIDRCKKYCWVGYTDLSVEFVVTDATTGEPIPGARVEGRLIARDMVDEQETEEFVLLTDADGHASTNCREVMCCGETGLLGISGTFVVYMPRLGYHIVAEDREPTKWSSLHGSAQRTGSRQSKLVVPISLQKE